MTPPVSPHSATRQWAELIRSFPSAVIRRDQYGREVELLFEGVRRNLDKGRGDLHAFVNDPDVVIYVNEIPHHQGSAVIGDLVAGTYRVLLLHSLNDQARVFEVQVRANQQTRLKIDWRIASLLEVQDGFGFRYTNEKGRVQEAELVRRLVLPTTSAHEVGVFSGGRRGTKQVLVGTLYAVASGDLVRSAGIVLGGRGEDARLRALAEYIAVGGDPGVDVFTVEHPEYTRPPPDLPVLEPPPATFEKALSKRTEPAPDVRLTVPPARSASNARRSSWMTKALVVTGATAVVVGGALFGVDEDLNPDGPQEPTYRNTRPAGVAIGAAGCAAVAAGVWWWLSGRSRSDPAVVSIGSTGVIVGWGRRF